jgi:hypothetical protein
MASPALFARGEHSLVEGFAAKEATWLAERAQLLADCQNARWGKRLHWLQKLG